MYSLVLMMALNGTADMPASCRGCRGCRGCYGCSGCYGGYGCCGGYGGGCSGCYGGRGGYGGGCYGGGCYGGGCYGGGCYGGGCYGGYSGGGMAPPPPPARQKGESVPAPKGEEARSAVPATIVVSLPGDASLTIDGAPTTSTSAQRTFVTPPLPAGQDYYYTFRAEATRDGQPVVSTQRVRVRPGEESRVTLEIPTSVAQR